MAILLSPQNLDEHNWYYEYKNHVLLVHECFDGVGNYICTDTIKIPWRMLETSRRRIARKRSRTQ